MTPHAWWLLTIVVPPVAATIIGTAGYSIAARRQDRRAAWDDSHDRLRRGLS